MHSRISPKNMVRMSSGNVNSVNPFSLHGWLALSVKSHDSPWPHEFVTASTLELNPVAIDLSQYKLNQTSYI